MKELREIKQRFWEEVFTPCPCCGDYDELEDFAIEEIKEMVDEIVLDVVLENKEYELFELVPTAWEEIREQKFENN